MPPYQVEIPLVISTNWPKGLKKEHSPYLVHFGRLPHWDSVAEAVYVPLTGVEDAPAPTTEDLAAFEQQLQQELPTSHPPSTPPQPESTPRQPLSATLTLEERASCSPTPQYDDAVETRAAAASEIGRAHV